MSNLKKIREERGLSQSQLAQLSDISLRMIQKYEIGEKNINNAKAITVYQLAKVLDCKMKNLLELRMMEMKVYYMGKLIGEITTNRVLSPKEIVWSLGYDVNDADDREKAYEDGFAPAYIDDWGDYKIDLDAESYTYDLD